MIFRRKVGRRVERMKDKKWGHNKLFKRIAIVYKDGLLYAHKVHK